MDIDKQVFFIGIDPQPKLISICMSVNRPDNVIYWANKYLKEQKKFKNLSDYLKYLHVKIQYIWSKLSEYVNTADDEVYVAIETQMGQVKSYIAITLFSFFFIGDRDDTMVSVTMVHPRTWRKYNGLKKGEGNNKKNKSESEKQIISRLIQAVDDNVMGLENLVIPSERCHDLCDSYMIMKYCETMK